MSAGAGGLAGAAAGGAPVVDAGSELMHECGVGTEVFTVREYEGVQGELAADERHLYWLEWGPCLGWSGDLCTEGYEGSLFRASHCGESLERLLPPTEMRFGMLRLDDYGVYFVSVNELLFDNLEVLTKDTLERTVLATDHFISGAATWDGYAFWGGGSNLARRVTDAERPAELLKKSHPDVRSVTVNADGVYFTGTYGLNWVPHEGGEVQFVADAPTVTSLLSTLHRVYWSTDTRVESVDGDGNQHSLQAQVTRYVPSEEGAIYWTQNENPSQLAVERADGAREVLATGEHFTNLTLSERYVFWVDVRESGPVLLARLR